MTRPGTGASTARLTTLIVTVAAAMTAAMTLCEGIALAQVRVSPQVAVQTGPTDAAGAGLRVDAVLSPELRRLQPIRDSLRTIDYGALVRPGAAASTPQPAASGRSRSVGRTILGAAVGATAGFFAGGYLGAAIEGDRCHCDDPGLKGAIIGSTTGAAAGGILGVIFLF